MAFAEILNQEARERSPRRAWTSIQFDEPAFNVYFDEVRDWGVAALERARAGPQLQDRGAHLLRLRHQGQHRLEEDARRRVAAVRADLSAARAVVDRPGVARMRQLARAASTSSRCSTGKDVLVGRDRRRHRRASRRPEEVARDDPRGAAVRAQPSGSIRAPTAGWCRWRREVARGKLAALGAGAALVRAELVSPSSGPHSLGRRACTAVLQSQAVYDHCLDVRQTPASSRLRKSRIVLRVFCFKQ